MTMQDIFVNNITLGINLHIAPEENLDWTVNLCLPKFYNHAFSFVGLKII